MFTYSPEQLEALRKVNELFIEAGTQLFYKMKGFREKMEIWNEEMSDKQTIQHMEDAFLHHEGTPYEYWLSKQLEGGINGLLWGDTGDASKPEGFVYQEPEKNEGFPGWDKKKNPEYWKHWDEGFDREKVKDIPICYLYHVLSQKKNLLRIIHSTEFFLTNVNYIFHFWEMLALQMSALTGFQFR